MQPESILHALWSCPCLNEVWESDQVWSFKSTVFLEFSATHSLHYRRRTGLGCVSMVVWSLWYRRNQVRVGNSIPPIGQTLA